MSRASAYRLLRRYQQDGWEGLRDRPPVAKHHPHRLSAEAEQQIVLLRRQTGWGPRAFRGAGTAGVDDLAGAGAARLLAAGADAKATSESV